MVTNRQRRKGDREVIQEKCLRGRENVEEGKKTLPEGGLSSGGRNRAVATSRRRRAAPPVEIEQALPYRIGNRGSDAPRMYGGFLGGEKGGQWGWR